MAVPYSTGAANGLLLVLLEFQDGTDYCSVGRGMGRRAKLFKGVEPEGVRGQGRGSDSRGNEDPKEAEETDGWTGQEKRRGLRPRIVRLKDSRQDKTEHDNGGDSDDHDDDDDVSILVTGRRGVRVGGRGSGRKKELSLAEMSRGVAGGDDRFACCRMN